MNKPSSSAMAAARDCTDSAYGPDLRIQHPDLAEVHDRLFRTTLERHFTKHMQIPEGWVLAKVKPTLTMLEAGLAVPLQFGRHPLPTEVVAIYKAMLSAAPPKGDEG